MSLVYGKALLVITRLDSEHVQFEITPYIQSATGGEYAHDCAHQDFGLLITDSLPLPAAAYKVKVGETIRVYVVYEFCYTQDYWGEWDVDLTYRKQRVLRKQRPREFYTPKAERSQHG